MARLSSAQVEELKRIPIVELAEASGVKLTRRGAQLVGRCIFHSPDKTPSLLLTPSKNLWHCMGACRTGGSVIDFVMKRDRVTFVRAAQTLRAFEASREQSAEPAEVSPKRPRPSASEKARPSDGPRTPEQLAALDEVTSFYTHALRGHARALAYMERRVLLRPDLIERFRLGFADQTLIRALPPKLTPEGAAKRQLFEDLGLTRQGYELLAGSLVVPILDDDGRVVSMYGRRISPPPRGAPVHRYLPGPHRGVFNQRALALSEEVIICEAIIDALTLISAGIDNVISAYGVEGFTPAHLAALKRHGTQRALIAYDRDKAGDEGASALASTLSAEGIACYRVEMPKGMDVNEYAMKLQPAEKSLPIVLKNAVPMGDAPPRPRPRPIQAPRAPAPELTPTPLPAPELAIVPTPLIEPTPRDAHEVGSEQLTPEPVFVAPEASRPEPGPAPRPAPASPLAAEPPRALSSYFAAPADVVMHEEGDEQYLSIEDRVYRVRNLAKNTSLGALKINLSATRGDAYFMDTLDLCQMRARMLFERLAAAELGLSEERMRQDLGKILRKLEHVQRERLRALLDPKPAQPSMTSEEESAALELLRDPKLFDRILTDYERAGVVGEETNKLVAYLVATSRKLDEPLSVIVQSSSAAGKSSLVEAALAFVPEEDCVSFSAMTGQSLYYMTSQSLAHKVLSIAEEEGAQRASYALKLLLSERKLTMAAPTKDDAGVIQTKSYEVEGPVAGFLTTTSYELDEELQNRCIVLTVDESRAQTAAIHAVQRKRETLEGLIRRRERGKVLRLHHNAQRLLRALFVANPRAEELSFSDQSTRSRRDHPKYLGLIRAVALLRQYHKAVKTIETELGEVIEYVEVDALDLEIAERLAREVLEPMASELPAQTARLLEQIVVWVRARAAEKRVPMSEVRFTRRELREALGVGNTRLKIHMRRLEDLEHVVLRSGGRGEYRFEYQLVTGSEVGDAGATVEDLKWAPPRATWSQGRSNTVASESADGRGVSPDGRGAEDSIKPAASQVEVATWPQPARSGRNGVATNGAHGAPR